VTRAGDIDGVQVVFVDQPVRVNVGEALAGIGAPITEEPRLRVLQFQRLPEQEVVLEVQHPHAEVEAGTPVRVDLAQLVGAERCTLDGERAVPYAEIATSDWSLKTFFCRS
jgi:hypothetical protein